jgi:hypothetical protein
MVGHGLNAAGDLAVVAGSPGGAMLLLELGKVRHVILLL